MTQKQMVHQAFMGGARIKASEVRDFFTGKLSEPSFKREICTLRREGWPVLFNGIRPESGGHDYYDYFMLPEARNWPLPKPEIALLWAHVRFSARHYNGSERPKSELEVAREEYPEKCRKELSKWTNPKNDCPHCGASSFFESKGVCIACGK